MLYFGVQMDVFIKQLMKLVKSIVVKRDEFAAVYETLESKVEADRYIAMIESGTNWYSFSYFDTDVLVKAGLNDDLIRTIRLNGKEAVPREFRDLVCEYQRVKVIDTYIEKNDYYRMLNGEPPYKGSEDNYVYLGENEYGIPTNVPIHQLPDGYLQYINTSSIRNELIAAHPDKPYLQFLGTRAIDYYHARVARNYDILFYEKSDNESISNEFLKCYAAARNYVMIGLYNKSDQRMYEHYDSFMGLLTVVVAVQKMFGSIFKQGISRDFFDENLIKELFTAYNFPYITTISIDYQKDIAKKLNMLLQKKSTNNVLFDIIALFDFPEVNIYQYYLVKDYHKDNKGNPIIIHNTVVDEYGEEHRVIDYEKTFDIYFQRVNIKSKDISADIANKSNRVPYEALTGGDPYWIDDSSLFNKLYSKKFNNILTKYMSISISYELAKLLYETSHGLRMMIDDNVDYKRIKIDIAGIVEPVSLYDTVVFLCALTAKKFGLAGNIPLKGHQIAQVYGFNFKTDMDMLKSKILNDIETCTGEYKKVRLEMLEYLKTLNATSLEGAVKMYSDIEALRKFLDNAMRYSTDIEEYTAYWKIYQSTLIVEDSEELYMKNDGTYAKTFLELLQDRRPDLYIIVNEIGKTQPTSGEEVKSGLTQEDLFVIDHMSNSILDKLSKISVKFNELRFANDKSEIVANIEKVINQLKSYTVDQGASSIIYLIRDPHLCLLKFICDLITASKDSVVNDMLSILQQDVLNHMEITSLDRESYEFKYEWFYEKMEMIETIFVTLHKIAREYKSYGDEGDRYSFYDILDGFYKDTILPFAKLHEYHYLHANLTRYPRDGIVFHSEEMLHKFITAFNEGKINIDDTLNKDKLITYVTLLNMVGKIIIEAKRLYFETMQFNHEIITKERHNYLAMNLLSYDIMLKNAITPIETKTKIDDDISKIFMRYEYRDTYILDKLISTINSLQANDRVMLFNLITLGMIKGNIEEKVDLAYDLMITVPDVPLNIKVSIVNLLFSFVNQRIADRDLTRILVYDTLYPEKADNHLNVKLPIIEQFIAMIHYNAKECVEFNEFLNRVAKRIGLCHFINVYNTLDAYAMYLLASTMITDEDTIVTINQLVNEERHELREKILRTLKDDSLRDETVVFDSLAKFIMNHKPYMDKFIRIDDLSSHIITHNELEKIRLNMTTDTIVKQADVRQLSTFVDAIINDNEEYVHQMLSLQPYLIPRIGYDIKENFIVDLQVTANEKYATIKHLSTFFNIMLCNSKDVSVNIYHILSTYLNIYKPYTIYVDNKFVDIMKDKTKNVKIDISKVMLEFIKIVSTVNTRTLMSVNESVKINKKESNFGAFTFTFDIKDDIKDGLLSDLTKINDTVVMLINKTPMEDEFMMSDKNTVAICDEINEYLTSIYEELSSHKNTVRADKTNSFDILILDNQSLLQDDINFTMHQILTPTLRRNVLEDLKIRMDDISTKSYMFLMTNELTMVLIRNVKTLISAESFKNVEYLDINKKEFYSKNSSINLDTNKIKTYNEVDVYNTFDTFNTMIDNNPNVDNISMNDSNIETETVNIDSRHEFREMILSLEKLTTISRDKANIYDALVLANMDIITTKFNLSNIELIRILSDVIQNEFIDLHTEETSSEKAYMMSEIKKFIGMLNRIKYFSKHNAYNFEERLNKSKEIEYNTDVKIMMDKIKTKTYNTNSNYSLFDTIIMRRNNDPNREVIMLEENVIDHKSLKVNEAHKLDDSMKTTIKVSSANKDDINVYDALVLANMDTMRDALNLSNIELLRAVRNAVHYKSIKMLVKEELSKKKYTYSINEKLDGLIVSLDKSIALSKDLTVDNVVNQVKTYSEAEHLQFLLDEYFNASNVILTVGNLFTSVACCGRSKELPFDSFSIKDSLTTTIFDVIENSLRETCVIRGTDKKDRIESLITIKDLPVKNREYTVKEQVSLTDQLIKIKDE